MTASPRKILADFGLAAHKGLGQNFIADPGVARTILDRADLDPGILAVEVGPGLGALTRPLLEQGFSVKAVELDRGLARYLEDELRPSAPDRLTVIQGDILETDLLEITTGQDRFILIGNLPYQISSPLLFKLLEVKESVSQAVLMFQRELAGRLTAEAGTKAYGTLSVLFGYFARIDRLLDVGPEVFFPRPKVGSTVLRIVFKDRFEPALENEGLFRQVVRTGFGQRRKTIKNSLSSFFEPEAVEAALFSAGIAPGVRAEALSVHDFARLANALAAL